MTVERCLNFSIVSCLSKGVRSSGFLECLEGLVCVVDCFSEFFFRLKINLFKLFFFQVSKLLLFIHVVLFPLVVRNGCRYWCPVGSAVCKHCFSKFWEGANC